MTKRKSLVFESKKKKSLLITVLLTFSVVYVIKNLSLMKRENLKTLESSVRWKRKPKNVMKNDENILDENKNEFKLNRFLFKFLC